MRMHAPGLESGLLREPAQDQECARASERAALSIEEELGPVPLVEVRPAAREVPPERVHPGSADRDDPLLPALADAADEALVEVDAGPVEPHRLADPKARAVQELGERAVAERARRHAVRRVDQPLGLARGERPRKLPPPARQLE